MLRSICSPAVTAGVAVETISHGPTPMDSIHVACTEMLRSKCATLDDTSRAIYDELERLAQGKHVLTFIGFSTEYNDPVSLEIELREVLQGAIAAHGAENLRVVAGATPVGIGSVYKLADEEKIATVGIVSEQVSEDDIACGTAVRIPDPKGRWKVLDSSGQSFIAYTAKFGTLHVYGGGEVALSELVEAVEQADATKLSLDAARRKFHIRVNFERSGKAAAACLRQNPGCGLAPIRSAFEHGGGIFDYAKLLLGGRADNISAASAVRNAPASARLRDHPHHHS